MAVSYEWGHVADIAPALVSAEWLKETADEGDRTGWVNDDTIGLEWNDGGGGTIVYGSPAEVEMFLRRALGAVENLINERR
jgi:hypothetical protein